MERKIVERILVRRWKPSDFADTAELNEAAEKHIGMLPESGSWSKDMLGIQEKFIDSGGDFMLGHIDNELVVMGGYTCQKTFAEIKRMRVTPDLQGKGIGRWFLTLLERDIKEKNIEQIVVSTTSEQQGALRLYEGSNYLEVGRRIEDRDHEKGIEIVTFNKNLSSANPT